MSILSVLHDVKQQSGAIRLNGWQNVSDNIAPQEFLGSAMIRQQDVDHGGSRWLVDAHRAHASL
jgi:hypothetical protein